MPLKYNALRFTGHVDAAARNAYRFRVRSLKYPKLVFSPDHRKLALFSGHFAIRIWNLESNLLIWEGGRGHSVLRPGTTFRAHEPPTTSPDWSRCAILTDGVVELRNVETGEIVLRSKHDAHSVVFSPDSRLLVSASAWGIKIRDAETGRKRSELSAGLGTPVASVVF